MKKYEYINRRYFAGALVSILCSNLFAVSLHFSREMCWTMQSQEM